MRLLLHRALTWAALALVMVTGWVLRLITLAPPPWRLTPDHLPVVDLSPTVPAIRAHAILTAGPPRPLAIAGTTG